MKFLEILWLKMANGLKEDTNKHMIKVKKFISGTWKMKTSNRGGRQQNGQKISNLDEKDSKMVDRLSNKM